MRQTKRPALVASEKMHAVRLARDLDRPAESAITSPGTVLIADEHVRDVLGQALRSEQDDFIVVDVKLD